MDVSKVSDSEIGICWTTATAAPWLGATSDAFPVCTFDVTFAKGAKPGKYNIELLNTNLPGQDNQSMTQVGKLDLSLPTLDQNHNGGLGEKNLTITIEGDETPTTTSTTPAVTTSTSATTSTSVNTTTSTQTTTNTTPTGDGLIWDIADIDYNKAEEYQYVDVNVTQAYGSDRLKDGVAGLQCAIKYDQDVLELVPLESGKSGAYGVVDYGTYVKDTGFTWGWANGDENGGLIANKGDNVTYFAFKVKDGAPAGTYPITVDTTYSFACSDGNGTRVPLTILPGSITIKGDTTTASTINSETTAKPDTTTTAVTTNTTPTGNGLIWDIADIDYNKAEEYQYVDVNVTQAYGSDRLKDGVAGLQCAIKYDQDVLELVPLESGKSGAYGVVDYGTYVKDTGFTWGWANGDENGGLIANKGDNVTYFAFKVKDGAPAGTYPITVDTTYSFACSDGNGTRVPLTILPGSITIKGDTTTDTTTATSETTTSATTTTTSATTTSETTKATDPTTASETTKATDPITGDVLYGDSNVDGKVNIADVVILNKYLTNAAKYPLSAQGAKNAEVDLDGTLTTNDSYCIIRAVVKLITLPYKA